MGDTCASINFNKKCPTCSSKYITKREGQVYCNQKCYSRSKKLSQEGKVSRMIRDNSIIPWRLGTGGKPFTNKTMFKKNDPRITGNNNYQWIKDREFKNFCLRLRHIPKYREWKKMITERDNEDITKPQVHHIKPFKLIIIENNIRTKEDAVKCKELWDLNNGIVLTKGEHQIIGLLERMKKNTKGFVRLLEDYIKTRRKKK